ncbi:hypothetical protein GCM10027019_31380 [Melaminivora jejuensis]|uniref:ParB/RepB/Spo0J family partition protein n=1 Tax=Melaminivora jejuensis TaxID=1267217 RepID=UPI001ADEEEDE|nr:ParB N-terminal domain-containing protein [Melaminivora jejuensis]UHJ63555.1 ParB/RepB/Spo0J family partition protein [Melaminivora jejuensis]
MENFDLNLVPGAVKAAMVGVKSADLWKVPRDRIKVMSGFNVRVKNEDHQAQVRFIADSMKANGFFPDKPLAGFVAKEDGENIIYVIDGHTRLEAVDLANSEGAEINEIPVVTKPAGTSMEDLTVALVVSNEGRHLTPYEVALVCKRLIGFGMDEAEVARRIGKSKPYVDNLLLLVSAPRAITNMVQEGTVSATLAVEAVKAHGSQAPQVLQDGLKEAQAQGKSKVTGRHLPKPAPVRKAAAPAVPAVNEVLERGVKWLEANAPQDDASVRLLAFLACVGLEEVEARINPDLSK